MAKRKKDGKIPVGEHASPSNNPFGGLAALRDSLPEGEPPAEDGAPDTQEGSPTTSGGKIVVRRERKGHGGKTVTRVSGLPADRLKPLTKTLKKALGCGARVEGEEILVQGDMGERIRDVLEAENFSRIVVC